MEDDLEKVDTQRLVSAVIPSWDANRNGNLPLLKDDLLDQTVAPFEIVVVEKTSPNGHARNVGVERTCGRIIVFLDDDVRLGSQDVIHTFVTSLMADPTLGIVGTSQLLPQDSSLFQRQCAAQLSRSQSDIVSSLTESDMATTQCCAMRRQVLDEVGGFHDKILRGVDPELRNRVRGAGYKIAVAPNAWHYHPMPATFRSLLQMAWRDGIASAYARRNYPETILYNPDGHVSDFDAKRSFPARIVSNLSGVMRKAFTGKWYGFAYGVVYAAGNLIGPRK